jgi:hypothetical protein
MKKVVLLDELLSEIIAVVDKAVERAYQMSLEQAQATSDKPIQLPTTGALTREDIEHKMATTKVAMTGEYGVVENYRDHAARFCVPVVATLALHPFYHRWTDALVEWTTQTRKSKWAIADGALQLKENEIGEEEETDVLKGLKDLYLDDATRQFLDEIGQQDRRDLGTWVLKSLTVGDEEVFAQVKNMGLQGGFSWQTCEGCGHKDHKVLLASKEHPGCDPEKTPWTLPSLDQLESLPAQPSSSRVAALESHIKVTQLKGVAFGSSLESFASGANEDVGVDTKASGSLKRSRNESGKGAKAKKKKGIDKDKEWRTGERREAIAQALLQQGSDKSIITGPYLMSFGRAGVVPGCQRRCHSPSDALW